MPLCIHVHECVHVCGLYCVYLLREHVCTCTACTQCIFVHVCTCIHVCAHSCMCVYECACMCADMHVHVCVLGAYTGTYVYSTYTQHVCICMRVSCARVCPCMRTRVCIYTCVGYGACCVCHQLGMHAWAAGAVASRGRHGRDRWRVGARGPGSRILTVGHC